MNIEHLFDLILFKQPETGLGKMIQEPRARFYVARCRVFCYLRTL